MKIGTEYYRTEVTFEYGIINEIPRAHSFFLSCTSTYGQIKYIIIIIYLIYFETSRIKPSLYY